MDVTLWEAIIFAIHVLALIGVLYLWEGAPDNVQRVIIALLGISLTFYLVIDIFRMMSPSDLLLDRNFFRAAALPMQFAVALWIGRLVQKRREEKCRKLRQG